MITINLPYGRKYYCCEICGCSSGDKKFILAHEAAGVNEIPDVAVGAIVSVDDTVWRDDWYEVAPPSSRSWVVTDLFHNRTLQLVSPITMHQLMITLTQTSLAGAAPKTIPYEHFVRFWVREEQSMNA